MIWDKDGGFLLNTYLKSLASEYLDLIEQIGSGMYSGYELRELESERAVLHKQLEEEIGHGRVSKWKMPEYARSLV